MTCPCKFPLLITYDNMLFMALPLEEFANELVRLPDIYNEKTKDGEFIVVKWRDDIHDKLNTFDVAGHDVLAGCDENELSCDAKSIYMVNHPKEEWDGYHMINIDKLKDKIYENNMR